MCTNTIKSDTGCDGGCIVDTKMYNKVMTEINSRLLRRPPKKGHWVTRPHVFGVAYCSECGFELKIDNTIFCPNCGADMREDEE